MFWIGFLAGVGVTGAVMVIFSAWAVGKAHLMGWNEAVEKMQNKLDKKAEDD